MIEEVAELKHDNERLTLQDQLTRKEFAKAFSWYKQRKQYDYGEPEHILPSWESIFVEIGRLKAARDFIDFEGNISELEYAVEDLKKRVEPINNLKQ